MQALGDLDGALVGRAYQLWAPIYDFVYGWPLERARHTAAEAARSIGGRVLEIGIGTGLSLKHYERADIQLYGIDFCEKMLVIARQKAAFAQYKCLKELRVMDAHDLAYPDGFFQCTVAQFVLTLVARPEEVLSECSRVTRAGGEIILINHFYSERGLPAALERLAARPLSKLGLRPQFPFSRLKRWADSDPRVELLETRKVAVSAALPWSACDGLPLAIGEWRLSLDLFSARPQS